MNTRRKTEILSLLTIARHRGWRCWNIDEHMDRNKARKDIALVGGRFCFQTMEVAVRWWGRGMFDFWIVPSHDAILTTMADRLRPNDYAGSPLHIAVRA